MKSAGLWDRHATEWRDTAQVVSQWRDAGMVSAQSLECKVSRGWWATLERAGLTLFVTREYEHLVMAMSARDGVRRTTYLPVPHPCGLVADRAAGTLHLASTRNPNQVYALKPAREGVSNLRHPLMMTSSAFYPGRLYLHDLTLIGGALYGNAVGQNAVVKFTRDGDAEPVWWPRCVESSRDRNYIQLNSIAAGRTLRDSFFSASSAAVGRLRPGNLNYPVDGHGVIFSGRTREPICTGLTRPHSARLRDGSVWVANSGYGEVGFVRDGRLEVVHRLPGWTRGLCFAGDILFAGTSRVIPKFARYAPGVDGTSARCAIHALCLRSGKLLGTMEWPHGNQIFGIDWMPNDVTDGFPFRAGARSGPRETKLFYDYSV